MTYSRSGSPRYGTALRFISWTVGATAAAGVLAGCFSTAGNPGTSGGPNAIASSDAGSDGPAATGSDSGFDDGGGPFVFSWQTTSTPSIYRVAAPDLHLRLPQTVLFTIWASSSAGWAGPLEADSAPTSAEVDWIKVYNGQP